jgi:hypothetical protein
MNVYAVEVETGLSGYRVIQHVRAVDVAEARARAQAAQGPYARIVSEAAGVVCLRPCTAEEIAERRREDTR